MKTKEIIKQIEKGNYKIETRSECGCSINYSIQGDELVCDENVDCCWIGYILVIAGVDIAQHIYGESFEWLVDVDEDTEGFEDIEDQIRDEMSVGDFSFGGFSFDMGTVPEHEDRKEKALIEFLNEKEIEGFKLMRDNARGFSNEYICILVSPQSHDEISEEWDELTPEEWASEYLYDGDAATQAYNSFQLI